MCYYGIQNGEGAIKSMLAGANAVAYSIFYTKKGAQVIKKLMNYRPWMQEKNFPIN
jgi:dihydroorotate dehydrogenase